MQRISARQSKRISELAESLGQQRLRAILTTSKSGRIIDPRRLARWQEGRGRLSAAEVERLANISTNAPQIKRLANKNEDKQAFRTNRAIREWLRSPKEKGKAVDTDSEKEQSLKSAKALRYLDVDPSDGTYYVRKRK